MNIAESTWKFMICFHVDSAMSVFDDLLFGDEPYSPRARPRAGLGRIRLQNSTIHNENKVNTLIFIVRFFFFLFHAYIY